jgi:hypothetical protein
VLDVLAVPHRSTWARPGGVRPLDDRDLVGGHRVAVHGQLGARPPPVAVQQDHLGR